MTPSSAWLGGEAQRTVQRLGTAAADCAAAAADRPPWRCCSSSRSWRRVRSPCAASRPSRCASACDWPRTRLRRSCAPAGGTPTAARSMRRCASTNSSERCTSIRVSLATASHGRSGRARSAGPRLGALQRRPRSARKRGSMPSARRPGRPATSLSRCSGELLQLESLRSMVPQGRVVGAFQHLAQRGVEGAGAGRSRRSGRKSRARLPASARRPSAPSLANSVHFSIDACQVSRSSLNCSSSGARPRRPRRPRRWSAGTIDFISACWFAVQASVQVLIGSLMGTPPPAGSPCPRAAGRSHG